jgi:aminomethyltransferase
MVTHKWNVGADNVEIAGQTVPLHYGAANAEYAAARAGAVVVPRPHVGRVRALDRDRLDLLHRLSTNDLSNMAVGEARATVLTTPLARIVDLLWMLNRGETALLVTGVGRATAVRRWLSGYIFYNDRVKFEDASAALGQLEIHGPHASATAGALLPGAESLAEHRFVESDDVIVWRSRPLVNDAFTVIAPAGQMTAVWEAALAAGATPAGEAAYQWLRIAAGAPGEAELTEDYIPLEANLWPAVSFTKGCYTGQEIIARMESRGKLARRLCGIKLAAPVSVGAEVRVNDTLAGHVTSAAVLPDRGPVALAYLKTAHAEPGTPVTVESISGLVTDLPFNP